MNDSVYNINETFIIEEVTNDTPVISACTALYSNELFSCTGDTFIRLGTGAIYFNGDLYTNDNLSANTINASTYLSGGTNLFNIIQLTEITGGTYNPNSGVLSLKKGNDSSVNISGIHNYYTTGATLVGNVAYFNRNDSLSAYTLDLTTLIPPTPFDVFVTGGTYSNGAAVFINNTGGTFTVSGFYTGATDVFVTGGTYSNGIATFTNNTGGTFTVNGFYTGFTGGFVSGLTATTISATTYQNLPLDIRVTGGTYSNGTTTFTNNTGGTFTINGFYTGFTGGSVSGLTATTISATTYQNLPLDVYTTGVTLNNSNYELTMTRNDGQTFGVNLGILSSDVTITGGSYNINTGVVTFTNNTGGTFSVSGFSSGMTDTSITNFTYNNNNFVITDSTGGTFNASINSVTGLTSNGTISSNVLSATTYQNLPIDIRVTGGTYSNGTTTFTNNTGGTFNVSGFYTGFTGGFVSGLTATTISATTYQNLPLDIRVTGGTYNNSTGTATFTNNTGGTFTVSGLFTGSTDVFVTGATYSNNNFTFRNNTGGTFSVLFDTITGLTSNGAIISNILSATTYQNLPLDIRVTGGTYNSGTGIATFTNNSGGTFSVSGFSTNSTTPFTGGTVSGETNFTNGLTATTISATTYLGLPLDIRVTGGTYNSGTGVATFTNNTGGTFTVNGFSTGGGSTFTGGTVNGATTFTSGLTANSLTVNGVNITGDTFVTGGTYNNSTGTLTLINNQGNALPNITGFTTSSGGGLGSFLPLSGGTVSGGTSFISGLTATTISATSIQFNTSYAGTVGVGQIAWDSNFGTLEQGLVGGNVTQKIGESSFALVKNVDSTTLNKGDVVYIFGATGDKISVKRASNTGDTTSSKTLGVVAETIGVNQNGLVMTQGTLDGLNLGAYNAGDILWLDANPGQFTNIKKYAPYHLVFIGVVQRANNGNGQIYIKPQNGYEFNELHDVAISGQSNNDIPYWNNSLGLWKNTNSPIFTSLTASTISATTYQNLPLDIRVTGGTFNNNNGIATFTNNTGGTFTVNNFPTTGTTLLWTAGTNTHSVAQLGGNNIASGNYSLAVGSGTTASGDYSHAGGSGTTAASIASFSMGIDSIASGSSITTSASPITITSAITITLSDPIYASPAVVLNGNVVNEWQSYYDNFCSLFVIYSGSSSQTIDCNTGNKIYEDSGLTYIVDVSITGTDYDMISGDTFEYVIVSVPQPAFAIGYAVKAYGANSFAEGFATTASGGNSHAEGSGTIASGDTSHAEGFNTIAGGSSSHAEGQNTIASGTSSHAEGFITTASGDYSHAEGSNTKASGNSSHAEGNTTTAIGLVSHAEGYLTRAIGYTSHAEGNGTTAFGDNSHAEGVNAIASGNTSHAEGSYTTAIGNYSHAEGVFTTAFGDTSHAEGYLTIASGAYSHAEGSGTTADGIASHAGGYFATAKGNYSFVHGTGSTANGVSTIVLGNDIIGVANNTTYVDRFNIKTVGSKTSVTNLGIDSSGNVVSGSTSVSLTDVWAAALLFG